MEILDSELVIRISEGAVRIFVGSVQIGLVQELSVRARSPGMTSVEMTLEDVPNMSGASANLLRSYRTYMDALGRAPSCVMVRSGDREVARDSQLVVFYSGKGEDKSGRTLEHILSKDDSWMERTHDFIQWMFPTDQVSEYNPAAPILHERDVEAFLTRKELRDNLERAADRMEEFLGLRSDRKPDWARAKDHNHLRITRMLRSLSLLGMRERALLLLAALKKSNERHGGPVNGESLAFWESSVL